MLLNILTYSKNIFLSLFIRKIPKDILANQTFYVSRKSNHQENLYFLNCR